MTVPRPNSAPSTSQKISMDDIHTPLPPGFGHFELTVVGATGLCGTPVWSQSQGGYVTVAIGGKQIHQTHVVDSGRDPEWKDTFQFVAKRDDDLIISAYATKTSSCDTILGKIEGSLENADCTGEEVSRAVSATQSGIPFVLKFRFESRSRLFGLVIGIDKYKSNEIRNLRGCKADAQSMVDLLARKLRIRSSHFLCLADERATRGAIISGFQDHLIDNNNIERGDSMVIFYAGHGSRAAAPKGWVADESQVETICPHDERTDDDDGKEIFGIPDRTIGGLLRKLCGIRGDNITVICDSCHSGGNTRMVRVARQAYGASPLPEELDQQIWKWGLSSSDKANGRFLDNNLSSHVLIAACRHNEVAFEDPLTENLVRGAFTHCLVKLLDQKTDLTQITYSTLVDQLPPLEHQHPQCSGKNRGRALFGGVVGHPTLFKLSRHCGGRYHAEAGEIQGVVKGTLFAIHAFNDTTSINSEIGILEAVSVSHHSCMLRQPDFDIPPGAKALMLNRRQGEDVLKVFVESPHDEVQPMDGIFSLVNSSDIADLVIRRTRGGAVQFERKDPLMSKYTPVLDDISSEPVLLDILQGISHFNFNLCRHNIKNPLKQLVEVVLHRLTLSNPEEISEEAIYVPDGGTSIPLALDHVNTVFAASEADADLDIAFYGLSVINRSPRKLFPYLIYFDPYDYSIKSWYHPPAETIAAPLPDGHGDHGPSELKVGYGQADVDAFQFSLADGVTADFGFLRLFVSTAYVDMSVLEQTSPFLATRGVKVKKPPSVDIWDAWTYVLKTARQ